MFGLLIDCFSPLVWARWTETWSGFQIQTRGSNRFCLLIPFYKGKLYWRGLRSLKQMYDDKSTHWTILWILPKAVERHKRRQKKLLRRKRQRNERKSFFKIQTYVQVERIERGKSSNKTFFTFLAYFLWIISKKS